VNEKTDELSAGGMDEVGLLRAGLVCCYWCGWEFAITEAGQYSRYLTGAAYCLDRAECGKRGRR
jgi:hypothetical protein